MSCPAVEHGKAIAESNAKRMRELIDQIRDAGVLDQMLEFIQISNHPENSFSTRLALQRLKRMQQKD